MTGVWGIKGNGKVCCPESDCTYGGFPQESFCRGCGSIHKECKLFKQAKKECKDKEDAKLIKEGQRTLKEGED
jgi:hypothetical protein